VGVRRQAAEPGPRKPAAAEQRAGAVWLVLLFPALVAFLAYANALDNGFVWDDPIILERQLVVFDSPLDVLVTPRGIPQFSPDYYRPVTIASYLLDRWLGDSRPFFFHLSVVVTHALCSTLVALLALQLLGRGRESLWAAAAAAALFAVHPVHTESVAWAAGRSDVLATVFLLAAMVVQGAGRPSWGRGVATGALALLALGAKEVGAAVIPLLILRPILAGGTLPPVGGTHPAPKAAARLPSNDGRGRTAGWLPTFGGLLTALIVYGALRHAALGELLGQQPGEASPTASLGMLFWAAAGYLSELVWPLPLNAFIDEVGRGPFPLAVFLAFAAGTVAALIAWVRHRQGVALFACLWIAITLLPSLAIVWKIPEVPMAERYLYLPSVGFCLLVALGLKRAHAAGSDARLRVAGFAVLIAAGLAVTIVRNPVWHDDLALWTDTVGKTRVSGMAWRSLGTAYLRVGQTESARDAFRRALTLHNPPRGLQVVHNNLGTIAMREGDYEAARRSYGKALEVNPAAADTLFNLGLSVFFAGGESEQAARSAIGYYRRAQQLSPHDPDIDAALGQAYAAAGDRQQAILHLESCLKKGVDPETASRVRDLLRSLRAAAS
jgi:Flp pilus assembly protein TadD